MKEELTVKQEKFIQNIVSGMSQRQAYKEAYNAENMTDKSIDEEACRLFNDIKISTRYKELMKELESKAIMTAVERMIWLTDVVKDKQFDTSNEGCKPADLNIKMKAIDILNKMSGEYVTKVEGNIGVTKLEDLL